MKKKETIIINNKDGKEGAHEKDLLNIKNPHDNLFSRIFTRKDKIIAFFKKYLPASVLEIIDIDSIEYVDSKHTPELGINLYSDIICRFRLKNKQGFLYICFEQQSKIDLDMPFRFLWYVTSTIKRHLEQGHKTVPILKNVLFYTGSRPWKASTKFDDYYDDPAIGSEYLHLKEFTLVTLPSNKEHLDYIDKDLGYCLAAFKCGMKGKDAYEEFKKFKNIPAFRNYFDKLTGEERLQAGIYIGILSSGSRYELEKIVTLVTISEQEKEKFMRTVAQKYHEEAIKQVAINMLAELHLDIDAVQKATKLNRGTIQNLLNDLNLKGSKKASQAK
jgi:predicted transposase/invertase (TIGR01784 family)